MKTRSIIYDISNLLFRVAAVQKNAPYASKSNPEEFAGLCMHISFQSVKKWFTKFKPDKNIRYQVVFAFEGGNNWRKELTKQDKRGVYKQNRSYDPAMAHFYELIKGFEEVTTKHTSVITLKIEGTEADDAIGVFCQMYASDDHEIIIVSGDQDYIQELRNPNVKLVNPDDGVFRNMPASKKYEPDLEYFLFKKSIRGDMGDYVPSAYPNVRETKIKKAYEDEYFRVNFMNETWNFTDVEGNVQTVRVGDAFELNKILVDLRCQPPEIRVRLEEGVKAEVENSGRYAEFHFLRFLGQHKLTSIANQLPQFVELFSNNQLQSKKAVIENAQINVINTPEKTKLNLLDF